MAEQSRPQQQTQSPRAATGSMRPWKVRFAPSCVPFFERAPTLLDSTRVQIDLTSTPARAAQAQLTTREEGVVVSYLATVPPTTPQGKAEHVPMTCLVPWAHVAQLYFEGER